MSTGQGMSGPELRPADLAKPQRTRHSGSPSEGSWITPTTSDTPWFRRTGWIAGAVAVLALVVVLALLLI